MFQTNIVEKIKTHTVRSKFLSINRTIYEIRRKSNVQPDWPHVTI